MRVHSVCGLLLAACFCLPTTTVAQDPAIDLPPQRVAGSQERVLQVGLARLRAGWSWEAARVIRELQSRDDTLPLPHLLMALAMRSAPNRAARHCFDAMTRKPNGSAADQKIVDAYQSYFGVTDQPELTDARFQRQPDKTKALRLIAALKQLASNDRTLWQASELAQVEAARLAKPTILSSTEVATLLAQCNDYITTHHVMPFMVPGYRRLVATASKGVDKARLLSRIPNHPHHQPAGMPVAGLPSWNADATPEAASATVSEAALQWRPQPTAGFDLPRGTGGRSSYDEYRGKPLLVVFFLGFGCAHCVAQLADLDPKAAKFREAGINVVTIGTDDQSQVLAARQAADENGVDPLHFDVLCDPKAKTFRQWGAWDDFSKEALHGTFLLDGEGRILWQDISLRPFEESDWLLSECRRLLAAWRQL